MTDKHWNDLLAVLRGERLAPLPVGFIIDSPWLPGWAGHVIRDYITGDDLWFELNRRVVETFPDVWFLPGFWSEFGMCTEPSAFGARCRFPRDEFPFAEKIIVTPEQAADVKEPEPATDGLLPFMLNRLKWARPRMEDIGHKVRFSVSRGPLNVASFLMGTTEFLMALKTDPEPMHRLLRTVTNFLRRWHALQIEMFPSIQGIMILDDMVGFMGEEDFVEFGLPYLRELYTVELPVKFFHNDAPCEKSLKYYPDIGINLFNPGIQSTINDIKRLSGNRLTVLGGIPPRDVLAAGTPDDVRSAVRRQLAETTDHCRLILSCGGGMPPGVTTANLCAFLDAARL
ncbi:MAG: uroporphyrinogen decarboxylase [Verrucomicrobiae bacterium]|nr:uroporphyrinogen decarboxylase [Verrucomicrobiae bacterium]